MTGPTPSVGLVRVDDVVFHPHNIRQDLGDLRALTNSIKRHGILQPVVVEKHAGKLRLRAGHRRVAAARLAGLARVPAVIHAEALDYDQWLIASVQENVMRAGLKGADRLRTVQTLLSLGCSRQGVAEAFGVGVVTVGNWLTKSTGEQPPKSTRGEGWKDGRLSGPKVRALVADWRDRNLDRDRILSELEALFPAPVPIQERARLKRQDAAA